MKILSVLAITAASASAATTSISFWAYDQHAQNSPYYSHYYVSDSADTVAITRIDMNDRGWGFSTTGTSSYHVSPFIESNGTTPRPLRSIGWHQYEFIFNDITKTASILMNGDTIQSGTYVNTPGLFNFALHDYYGGTQETVIDDFQMRINGSLVYQQGFDGATLPDDWYVSRQDGGTYTASGDATTVHSGTGSMALGATTGGNLNVSIAFDLILICLQDETNSETFLACQEMLNSQIDKYRPPRRCFCKPTPQMIFALPKRFSCRRFMV